MNLHTYEDVRRLIDATACPPYQFLLFCLECSPWGVGVSAQDPEARRAPCNGDDAVFHPWAVQARLWREDIVTEEWGWGYGAPYLVLPTMARSEVVKKCFVAALAYAEHEVREAFTHQGVRVLGPHIDVDALAGVARRVDVP